jgi:hypothetical protein
MNALLTSKLNRYYVNIKQTLEMVREVHILE